MVWWSGRVSSEHFFSEHVFSEVDSEYVLALEFSEPLFRMPSNRHLRRAAACSVESGASTFSVNYNQLNCLYSMHS